MAVGRNNLGVTGAAFDAGMVGIRLIEAATKNDPTSSTWAANGAGRDFSHQYGFGRVDAWAAVTSARNWTNVPAEATPVTNSETIGIVIPDNNATGITRGLSIVTPSNFVTEDVETILNV